MKEHEVCTLFPMMNDDEYLALVKDIREHGLIEPIWVHDDQIIDGRNRYRACREIGIEPAFREWDGDGSLVAFVVSLNLHRRHLTSGQRAIIAVPVKEALAVEARVRQLAGLRQYHDDTEPPVPQRIAERASGESRDQAAILMGTNRSYVDQAEHLLREEPDLAEEVREGKRSMPNASKEMRKRRSYKKATDVERGVPDAEGNLLTGIALRDHVQKKARHARLELAIKDLRRWLANYAPHVADYPEIEQAVEYAKLSVGELEGVLNGSND